MPHLSRRKFLYVGAGVLIALGSEFAIGEEILPRFLPKYPQGLKIEQISTDVEYPPIQDSALVVTVKIQNLTPSVVDHLIVRQSGLKGFKFKSADQNARLENSDIGEASFMFTLPGVHLEQLGNGEITVIYEAGWDSQTSDLITQANGQYFQNGIFGLGGAHVPTASNEIRSTVRIIPVPQPLRELYQQGKQEWVKDVIDRKILLQYPIPAELQDTYWRSPTKENGLKVLDYFNAQLTQDGSPYADLADELHRLPDLQNSSYDANVVKTVENIVSLTMYDTPKENFQALLSEGIKEKRKFSTPLQALYWISAKTLFSKKNNPLNNPSLPYSTNLLLSEAWDGFDPDSWNDFQTVTDRLNFPSAILRYMQSNISYSYVRGEPEGVHSAKDVFVSKKGACYDHAVFAAYCLKKNGYDAKGMKLTFKNVMNGYFRGHILAIYLDPKDSMYHTIDVWYGRDEIFGPFKSQREAAEYSCREAGFKAYSLHEVDLGTGKWTTTWYGDGMRI